MKFTILALAAALAAPSDTVVTAAPTKQTVGHDGEGELEPISITPIPIIPDDASLCGSNIPYFCEAEDWVYCINANCDAKPTVDANLYGGKPYVNCACWEQSTRPALTPGKQSTFSILPMGTSGANCVLDNMEGGEEMCEAMKGGALVSTYGPYGWKPNTLESAVCLPRTPWSWCWGAPCIADPDSDFGITCHCPYMYTDTDVNQPISLAGEAQCGAFGPLDPCNGSIHNSMPAGTSPNTATPCFTEGGAETCTECCADPGPPPPGPPKSPKAPKNSSF